MSDALQIAAAGMTTATRRLNDAAERAAAFGAPVDSAPLAPAAQVDLSATALDLIGARFDFALNAAVLRKADDMSGQLLDIVA